MPDKKNNPGWTLCRLLAVGLMVAAFTPLFLPPGAAEPLLFGLPYTLWSGIGICLAMVALTAVATVVHPGGGAGAVPTLKRK